MVGCDTQVRRALPHHLQDGVEHSCNRTERPVNALRKASQAIEMAEELVGPVDEMNDHTALFRKQAL